RRGRTGRLSTGDRRDGSVKRRPPDVRGTGLSAAEAGDERLHVEVLAPVVRAQDRQAEVDEDVVVLPVRRLQQDLPVGVELVEGRTDRPQALALGVKAAVGRGAFDRDVPVRELVTVALEDRGRREGV